MTPVNDMTNRQATRTDRFMRPVRSFVRREGRVTGAQRAALERLWPRYGFELPPGRQLDPLLLFDRAAPLVLEIGYGDGEALVDIAGRRPDINFIGAEVYTPGIGHCLMRIEEDGLDNVRLCREDAVDLLRYFIPDELLDEVRLFFPDPWPKKKHHKRRIVNRDFCELLGLKLVPGGQLHFATDWAPYAEWVLEILDACPWLENTAGPGNSLPRPETRIETKFERRGQRLGQASRDLIYRKVESAIDD